MKVTHEYYWTEHGVIPPRCRKPRDVTHSGELTVEVAEVGEQDAPVAFEVLEGITERQWQQLRWWGGKLWASHMPWSQQSEPSIAGSSHFPALIRGRNNFYASPQTAEAELTEWAAGYLIVDQVVYRAVEEPRYYVATFGFGGNHGGTGLMVGYGYRHDVPKYRHFTAVQVEEARAGAIAVALGRGDTRDAERYRTWEPEIRVLLPEAQTLVIPNTYAVTVAYTDKVTFEVVAGSELAALDEAERRVREGDLNGLYPKVEHDPSTVLAVNSRRVTATSTEEGS